MGGLKFSVHPLTFLFGFYYALTGRIFIFIIYTLTAIVHELGHSIVALGRGFKLDKITLMPFGAVISGDTLNMSFNDEAVIAVAGPIVNLLVGFLFVALWWIFPDLYPLTDTAAEANFSMAVINFIPVFPLDGGRIVHACTVKKFGYDKARKICKVTGIVFAVLLFGLFIYSLFFTFNLSLLFFSLFVLLSAFNKDKENKYVSLYSNFRREKLKKGVPVYTFAVDKSLTVKRLLSLLNQDGLNLIEVYDGEEKISSLNQKKINSIMEKGDLYSPIEKYI